MERKLRHFRAYLTTYDSHNVRYIPINYLCYNMKDAYKYFLHFSKDNPYWNLCFVSVYEVLENGFEKRLFFFDVIYNSIFLVANDKSIAVH